MRIAIIDSGIGGLTVTEAIKRVLPEESYFYCSDNAHFPYGEKSQEEVLQYTLKTAEKVMSRFQPDLLVVACSTASTIALEALRSRYDKPIVGVVPAIKPAAELSSTKVIGLLATQGTVNRPYTNDLIVKFASHCKVVKLGSSKLVQMAESKMAGEEVSLVDLQKELGAFLATPEMDSVVLGCTHFPVLKVELEKIAPRKMRWLEPGEAIARRVLELAKHTNRNTDKAESIFCYTKQTKEIEHLASRMSKTFGFCQSVFLKDM